MHKEIKERRTCLVHQLSVISKEDPIREVHWQGALIFLSLGCLCTTNIPNFSLSLGKEATPAHVRTVRLHWGFRQSAVRKNGKQWNVSGKKVAHLPARQRCIPGESDVGEDQVCAQTYRQGKPVYTVVCSQVQEGSQVIVQIYHIHSKLVCHLQLQLNIRQLSLPL